MRKTVVERKTNETDIRVELNLDGEGEASVDTGVPFLDHMLKLFAFHGRFGLEVRAAGDLAVDDHHTVEDVGIVLGDALLQLIRENQGIIRYGSCLMPMDEVLARVVIDVSGRAYLRYNASFQRECIGNLSTENVQEFFRALVRRAGITLHIDLLEPGNDHHQIEAMFKGFGRALQQSVTEAGGAVASTKGVL
ncbi:MAG TPA: imidazoleglycerol-phosphate dehydratase HisB [bacterium]|nr:imidazoleglycerol-phosphate dehydratase HisB [bacterium]